MIQDLLKDSQKNDDDFQNDEDRFIEREQVDICQRIMRELNMPEEGSKQPTKSKKNERVLTEQEIQAKQVRIKEAHKYFQYMKLCLVEYFGNTLRKCQIMQQCYQSTASKYLCFLSPKLLQSFSKLKETNHILFDVQIFLQFMKKCKQQLLLKEKLEDYNELLWSFCESLGVCCRKVNFIDFTGKIEESAYCLRYDREEKKRRKQKKKSMELQRFQLQKEMFLQVELEKDEGNFVDLNDFSFEKSVVKPLQSQQQNKEKNTFKDRRQNIRKRRKNYQTHYFQIYSFLENRWELVNSQILEVENIDEFKKNHLEGKPIFGFYSTRILHYKEDVQKFATHRLYRNVESTDLTIYFEDDFKYLKARRRRCGIDVILKNLIRRGIVHRRIQLLTQFDQEIVKRNMNLQLNMHLNKFPQNRQALSISEFFILKSQVPKYGILSSDSKEVEGKQFDEEKVHLRRDMINVISKNGWIDRGRKVRKEQKPFKTVQNKNKKITQLFVFEQTEPFILPIDEDTGDFIPDQEYDSIYLPKDYQIPSQLMIFTKKIGSVCKKANIRHIKVVSGFQKSSIGKIIPNVLGYLIYKEDYSEVQRLAQQRLDRREENREKNQNKIYFAMWKKLIKNIQLKKMLEL